MSFFVAVTFSKPKAVSAPTTNFGQAPPAPASALQLSIIIIVVSGIARRRLWGRQHNEKPKAVATVPSQLQQWGTCGCFTVTQLV
jgi:hypothetical protein